MIWQHRTNTAKKQLNIRIKNTNRPLLLNNKQLISKLLERSQGCVKFFRIFLNNLSDYCNCFNVVMSMKSRHVRVREFDNNILDRHHAETDVYLREFDYRSKDDIISEPDSDWT